MRDIEREEALALLDKVLADMPTVRADLKVVGDLTFSPKEHVQNIHSLQSLAAVKSYYYALPGAIKNDRQVHLAYKEQKAVFHSRAINE